MQQAHSCLPKNLAEKLQRRDLPWVLTITLCQPVLQFLESEPAVRGEKDMGGIAT